MSRQHETALFYMSKSYANLLQRLCQDYANRRMSYEEYRSRRHSLLEKIDQQFNGVTTEQDGELTSTSLSKADFGIASIPVDRLGKPN